MNKLFKKWEDFFCEAIKDLKITSENMSVSNQYSIIEKNQRYLLIFRSLFSSGHISVILKVENIKKKEKKRMRYNYNDKLI